MKYLDYVKSSKRIEATSPEQHLMNEMIVDALKITHKINSEYHKPEDSKTLR